MVLNIQIVECRDLLCGLLLLYIKILLVSVVIGIPRYSRCKLYKNFSHMNCVLITISVESDDFYAENIYE